MVNAEHLAILVEGVKAWNKWRRQHHNVEPDLSGADLPGADLYKVNFGGAKLSHAHLSGADLSRADLYRANSWTLSVYDAAVGGTLLASASSGEWSGNPYVGLGLGVPGIMRFEAVNTAAIAYDDLSFNRIPAPGAILLGSIGPVEPV